MRGARAAAAAALLAVFVEMLLVFFGQTGERWFDHFEDCSAREKVIFGGTHRRGLVAALVLNALRGCEFSMNLMYYGGSSQHLDYYI